MVKEQKIIIKNNKNQNLVGYHTKASDKIVMIICHGLKSYSEDGFYQILKPYTDAYNNMGISTIRFDATGFGESKHDGAISMQQYVADIGSVIEQYEKDYEEIILNVASFSGRVGTIAALRYPQITKLMVTNGLFNFRQIHRSFRIKLFLYLLTKPLFLQEILFVKKFHRPYEISVPTLVVVSEKDTIINPKQSFVFHDQLRTHKTLVIIANADHYAESFDDNVKASFQKVLQWLSEQLKLPLPK